MTSCSVVSSAEIMNLRFDVDDGHKSISVNLLNGVELRAVQRAVVRAVLEVGVHCDVGEHRLIRHKYVVAFILFLVTERQSTRV